MSDRSAGSQSNSVIENVSETGIANCDAAARIGGIHLFGVLHKQPLAIARITGAITRYEPDIVALEVSPEAIHQHHPDVHSSRWPPEHELDAAAYVADRRKDLLITGIDTMDWEMTDEFIEDFARLDREIFTELEIIESAEQLSPSSYYKLDLSDIQQWRAKMAWRIPEAFKIVLADREDVMAGHLHAIYQDDAIDTMVVALGMEHLTGVIELLQKPSRIPDDKITLPPVANYHTI